MSPYQRNAQLRARIADLPEYPLYFRLRRPLGNQQRSHQPSRRSPHRSDVIGVDLHQVPTDEIGRKGDGVGLGDEEAIPKIDERGILSGPRSDEDPRVAHLDAAEEAAKEFERQLSCLHWTTGPRESPTTLAILHEPNVAHPENSPPRYQQGR